MAWPAGGPRTWVAGEKPPAATLNAHIRDALNVLKSYITDSGMLRVCLKRWASGTPQANSGSTETELTNLTYTLPAGTLAADGDALVVSLNGAFANNTNAKTVRIYVNTSFATIAASSAAVATNKFLAAIRLVRIGSTAVQAYGFYTKDAAPGAAPTVVAVDVALAGGSIDLAASQTVKVTAQGTASSDVLLARGSITKELG